MGAHGRLADRDPVGNLLVAEPLGDQRSTVISRSVSASGAGCSSAGRDLLQQLAGNRRMSDGSPRCTWRMARTSSSARSLEQVPSAPALIAGKSCCRRRNCRGTRMRLSAGGDDLARRLDAVHAGISTSIRMTSGCSLWAHQHRLLPGTWLPHDLEAAGFREQGADTLAHDGMVVDNQEIQQRF